MSASQFLLDLPAAFRLTDRGDCETCLSGRSNRNADGDATFCEACGRGVDGNMLAKQIRTDIAAAVKAGVFPKGTKVSVRQNAGRYWTPCGSLTVSISAWPGAVYSDAYAASVMDGRRGFVASSQRYTQAFADALDLIEKIADRHNFDKSDIQRDHFDVGYYLNVHGGKAETAAIDGLEEEAALVARRRTADLQEAA